MKGRYDMKKMIVINKCVMEGHIE